MSKHAELGEVALYGVTGGRYATAVQSDAMQGKGPFWRARPFDDALHCLDAPDRVPTGTTQCQGVVWMNYEKRGE